MNAVDPRHASFALYFARLLAIEHDYRPWPLALPAGTCDAVLCRTDGQTLEVACIVDAVSDPQRTFSLPPEQTLAFARRQLTDGAAASIIVRIFECRSGTSGKRHRAENFAAQSQRRVVIQPWLLDLKTGSVWSPHRFAALLYMPFLRRILRRPRLTDKALAARHTAAPPDHVRPWLTWTLVIVLFAMYALTLHVGFGNGPTWLTTISTTHSAFGALTAARVFEDGEWYRMVACVFLHSNPGHLVMNALALYFIGAALERVMGRIWLAAFFTVGAGGGAVASLFLGPATAQSVGASGAIMGLAAALVLAATRLRHGPYRHWVLQISLGGLVPAIISPLITRQQGNVDVAAHVGGAIAGALIAYVVLARWRRTEVRPPMRGAAAAIAAFGLVATLGAAAAVSRDFPRHAALQYLAPDEAVPSDAHLKVASAAELVRRYPRDPRVLLYYALALDQAGRPKEAQEKLRAALREGEMLKAFPEHGLEINVRGYLAVLLWNEGRRGEARDIAQPVCRAGPDGTRPESLDEDFCK